MNMVSIAFPSFTSSSKTTSIALYTISSVQALNGLKNKHGK